MNQPDNRIILEKILDNIGNIELLLKTTTEDSFMNDLKDFNAICLEFIQIGEKVNLLPEAFYDEHPSIPWHELYGLRTGLSMGMRRSKRASFGRPSFRIFPLLRKRLWAFCPSNR